MLWHTLWTRHGSCVHRITAVGLTCTQKRPVQEQANQHSSMDGSESLEAPLLALTATDERGRRGVCFLQRCGHWSDAPTSVNNTHAAETNR